MWICVFVCLLPLLFWYVLMACSLYSLPEVSECLSSWMLSSVQLSDLKILRPLSVSLCDWSWLCACSLIKLCRSKAHPTHTHKLCPLCYPPYSSLLSPPPLSPPFQQGNSMLCNFCQMSNTSLPSSAVLFPSFLTLTGWTETLNPLPPPRSTYCSQQQNMNPRGQAAEAAALPKQKGMPKQMHFPHCVMRC